MLGHSCEILKKRQMSTGHLLSNSDLCELRGWYSQRWQAPFLSPKEILYLAVEHGLMAEGEPGEAAEAHAMDLAVDPGIDSAETDLLGLSSHIASFANFLAWLLQGQKAWKRPEDIGLPDGSLWRSGAFLDASESHLRRVVLLDRWDAWAQSALERSWEVLGECSIYGVGMDCLIVEIGSLRKGRWRNPFTQAYRHPVSKTLRFKKRDGEDFGSTWNKVEREYDSATRDEWLDSMTDDGVFSELVHIHSVQPPEHGATIAELAEWKLKRLEGPKPRQNLTACFAKINPCPYRSCCPRGLEPSPEKGFVQITSSS